MSNEELIEGLKVLIEELRTERFQQEKNGQAKAALKLINELETRLDYSYEEDSFTTYDTRGGHCGLCGRLGCTGCFK